MSLALLFPGQGAQHPAMLSWLDHEPAARDTLALIDAGLGADWRSRLEDQTWSSSNTTAQPLLTGLAIAAWRCLAPHVPNPIVCAGYSVGELPAFCAADVFDAPTAMRLAQVRAAAMEAKRGGEDTGLMAVQGVGQKIIEPRVHGTPWQSQFAKAPIDVFSAGSAWRSRKPRRPCVPWRTLHAPRDTRRVAHIVGGRGARDFARQLEAIEFQTRALLWSAT